MTRLATFLASACICASAQSAERLVLDLDLDRGPMSMSHNIENFLFAPTRNYAAPEPDPASRREAGGRAGVVNDMTVHDALKDHLVVSALVKMDGKVVGMATEQEYFLVDPATGRRVANSMWLIRLNAPGLAGFLVINQLENGEELFSVVQKVMENPEGPWEDETKMYLSTWGEARVARAWGDLAPYQGGIFEEYNGLNPTDLAEHGGFTPSIRFIIHPAED